MERDAKGLRGFPYCRAQRRALYGNRPTSFLNPPLEENGFGPRGPPLGDDPPDPPHVGEYRISLRKPTLPSPAGTSGGPGGAKPFSASGGIKNGAARFPYRAHRSARQYGNPASPWRGFGGGTPNVPSPTPLTTPRLRRYTETASMGAAVHRITPRPSTPRGREVSVYYTGKLGGKRV